MAVVKTLSFDPSSPLTDLAAAAVEVLREGGLVCLPCAGRYRILADLTNSDAVMKLMQAKSRIKTAPALVFVADESALASVTDELPDLAKKITNELWPQPITIRVAPSAELPKKVLKQLGGKKVKLGVRTPAGALPQAVAKAFGSPLLVSSANRQKKSGESSPAQVSKTFGAYVDLFINQGDLQPETPSTIVKIVDDSVVIERAGAVNAETIERCTSA